MNIFDKIKSFFSEPENEDNKKEHLPVEKENIQPEDSSEKSLEESATEKTAAEAEPKILSPIDEWKLREAEFRMQPNFQRFRLDGSAVFTMGYVLYHTMRIQPDEIKSTTFISRLENDHPRVLSDANEVWNFDIISALNYTGEDASLQKYDDREITFIITYAPKQPDDTERQSLSYVFVHLRGETDKEGTKYIRLSVTIPPYFRCLYPETLPIKSKHWDILFAIDETDPTIKMKEFDYLRADTKEKIEAGQKNRLTSLQHDLLFETEYDIAMHAFVAEDLRERGHYGLAITLYLDVLENLRVRWVREKTSELEDKIMFSCIYALAICHYKLHFYAEAVYYLDMLSPYNPFVDHITFMHTFMNCLIDSGDIRTLYVVKAEFDRMDQLKKKNGKLTEKEVDFGHFLNLSAGNFYVRQKMYAEAKKIFQQLLKVQAYYNRALDALAYIQQKEKNETKE